MNFGDAYPEEMFLRNAYRNFKSFFPVAFIGFFLSLCWFGIIGAALSVVALSLVFVLLWFSCGKFVLNLHQARVLERSDSKGLAEIVDHLAQRLGVPAPALYLVHDQSPFVLSIGRDQYNSAMIVSQGFLSLLNYNEMKAIIAHELIRIARGEIFYRCFSAMVFGLFYKPLVFSAKIIPIIPLAARFLKASNYDQKLQYQIDSVAAKLSDRPENLVNALLKIQRHFLPEPLGLRLAVSHLYVVNPMAGHPWLSWISNQPSVSDRIQRLLEDFYERNAQ